MGALKKSVWNGLGGKIEGKEDKQLLVNSQSMTKRTDVLETWKSVTHAAFDCVPSFSLEYLCLPVLAELGTVGSLLSTLTKNGPGIGEEQGRCTCEHLSSCQSRRSRKMVSTGPDNQLDPLPQLRGYGVLVLKTQKELMSEP